MSFVAKPMEISNAGIVERFADRINAGAAVVFRFSPAPVAKTTHHQRDRRCSVEVCRRTRPMVCFVNVEKRGRYHLLHLPEIQSGLENQHPLRIYTSRLTVRQSIEQRTQLQ